VDCQGSRKKLTPPTSPISPLSSKTQESFPTPTSNDQFVTGKNSSSKIPQIPPPKSSSPTNGPTTQTSQTTQGRHSPERYSPTSKGPYSPPSRNSPPTLRYSSILKGRYSPTQQQGQGQNAPTAKPLSTIAKGSFNLVKNNGSITATKAYYKTIISGRDIPYSPSRKVSPIG